MLIYLSRLKRTLLKVSDETGFSVQCGQALGSTILTSFFFLIFSFPSPLCSLLRQLVEVRKDLSAVLHAEVEEERESLQMAVTDNESPVPVETVDSGTVSHFTVDSDFLSWLNGCLDADSMDKVCV